MIDVNNGMSYAIISFVSFLQLLVIYNRTNATNYKETVDHDFRKVTLVFAGFCLVDILWGVCYAGFSFVTVTFFTLTVYGYYIMTAFAAYFWFDYMMKYMDVSFASRNRLNIVKDIILVVQVGMMVYNQFTLKGFYISDDVQYHQGPYRNWIYLIQFSYYIIICVYALLAAAKEEVNKKKYWKMFTFSLVPLLFGIGQMVFWELSLYAMGFAFTAVFIYAFNVSGVREEFALNEAKKLDGFANTDALTGIENRRAYALALREYAGQDCDRDFIYVTVDVNALKHANDTLGHEAGDEMIVGVAKCMAKAFGKCGRVFRTGGDEYVAMLKLQESQQDAVFEEFESLVSEWKGKIAEKMTVSVGKARWKDHPHADIYTLARIADKRMYADKDEYYKIADVERRS